MFLTLEQVSELTGVKPEKIEEITDNSDELLYMRKGGVKHYRLQSIVVVTKEIARLGRPTVKKVVPRKLSGDYMTVAKDIHHLYNKANSYKKEDRKPARDQIKKRLREAFV